MRVHPGVKLPLSMRRLLQVVTRSTRGEISARIDFTSVLNAEAKFNIGANSVRFQRVTAISFYAVLYFVCAML